MKFFIYLLNILNAFIFASKDKVSNNLEKSKSIKYLEFSFIRNITKNESLEPEKFFNEYFYNQIYILIAVGSQKIKIPFYFYLQQFPLVIQSSNVSNSQVKGIYNEQDSKTYKAIKTEQTFTLGDLETAIFSEDKFYLDNKESFINFYLAKDNTGYSHITEGGKIGFKPYPFFSETDDSSFLTNLKNNKMISENVFTFKYDSNKLNEDSGKLYIGAHPYEFNIEQYKEDYYIRYRAQEGFNGIDWIYNFNQVKIGDNVIEEGIEAYFYSEIGFIIGTQKFFNYLTELDSWKTYFVNNKKCHEHKFKINDFESNGYYETFTHPFIGYYCDKDVNIEKLEIGEISFVKRQLNYIFNFTYKELWMEQKNYNYFMIIRVENFENEWIFGKPFFKKYQLVFEYENRQIGLYTKILEENSNNSKKINSKYIYIIIIVGLAIIIFILAYFLIKCYYKLPRQKKANELMDDNYDYTEQNAKIN